MVTNNFDTFDTNGVSLDITGDNSGAVATAQGTTTGNQLTSVDTILTSDNTFEEGEPLSISEASGLGAATATATL